MMTIKIINKFIKESFKILKEINFLGWSGMLATIIGIMSFMPILYEIILTKKTTNFTITNIILALISNMLWITYGITNKLYTPTISGVLYLIIYGFIMIYKIIF